MLGIPLTFQATSIIGITQNLPFITPNREQIFNSFSLPSSTDPTIIQIFKTKSMFIQLLFTALPLWAPHFSKLWMCSRKLIKQGASENQCVLGRWVQRGGLKTHLKRPFKKGLLSYWHLPKGFCDNPLLNSGSYLGKPGFTEEQDSLKVSDSIRELFCCTFYRSLALAYIRLE